MSIREEFADGLVWNYQRSTIGLADGWREKLATVQVRRLPATGQFLGTLRRLYPEVQALILELDEHAEDKIRVDFGGLDDLGHLRFLYFDRKADVFTSASIDGSKLGLVRIIGVHIEGVTDRLVASPQLKELELEDASMDILLHVKCDLEKLALLHMRRQSSASSWNHLENLRELEIESTGTAQFHAPEDDWPELVSVRFTKALKGLVEASKVKPLKLLYLEGIRGLGTADNFWELRAERVTIGFATKPPKWLVEAWPNRPDDWFEWLVLPYHKSLPGSEMAWHMDFTDDS